MILHIVVAETGHFPILPHEQLITLILVFNRISARKAEIVVKILHYLPKRQIREGQLKYMVIIRQNLNLKLTPTDIYEKYFLHFTSILYLHVSQLL